MKLTFGTALALTIVAAVTVIALAAPASKAAPIQAGDVCHRCARVITDQSLAAEGIAASDGAVRKFRTVACMLAYLTESGEKLDILVTDLASGRLTQARWASFVRTTVDRRTGAEDYVAFGEHGAARQFAHAQDAGPMSWTAMRAAERRDPLATDLRDLGLVP